VVSVRFGIPPPFTGDAWERFFLAVRTAVHRTTGGLLSAWDDASLMLNAALITGPDAPTNAFFEERGTSSQGFRAC
jgi:hypothetical protein